MKMKIHEYIDTYRDVSISEVINEFKDDVGIDVRFPDDIPDEFEGWLEFNVEEISEDDFAKLKKELESEIKEIRKSAIAEETKELSSRKKILEWIDWVVDLSQDYIDRGDVGYILTPKEILDNILKNGHQ